MSGTLEYPKHLRHVVHFVTVAGLLLLSACTGTRTVNIESNFPVPLMQKNALHMGLLLDEDLLNFSYQEKIEGKGEWNVPVGTVQRELFANLSSGMFTEYSFVASVPSAETQVQAVLKPAISDLQFSLPEQTRSNFYEVWIRYTFQLFDAGGNLIAEWPLPAYGKANKKDYGSANKGVTAAAVAACRDAMAFFAINFKREPKIEQWLKSLPQSASVSAAEWPPQATATDTAG